MVTSHNPVSNPLLQETLEEKNPKLDESGSESDSQSDKLTIAAEIEQVKNQLVFLEEDLKIDVESLVAEISNGKIDFVDDNLIQDEGKTKHSEIISHVDEMWGMVKPTKNQLVLKICLITNLLIELGNLMVGKSEEAQDELGIAVRNTITGTTNEPRANDTETVARIQALETSLPEKVNAIFKSVMEMGLADFKENYRKHTTHVSLIVSLNSTQMEL